MKEFPNESKNKWTRIFKKKWFFPAVYLLLAAFLLTGVVWYQSLENQLLGGVDEEPDSTDSYSNDPYDEEAESVVQQQETIKMPVEEDIQTEIVTKFFDYEDEQDEQEKGLNLYNNRYYQSTGVNVAADDGEPFDVVASMSGTVAEVKEDPLLGNVVILSHEDDISTYYASLGEIAVDPGDKVAQGDQVGVAGKNLFSEESGNHVHFEIRKDDIEVNPEMFFNESVLKLVEYEPEEIPEAAPSEEDAVEEDSELDEEPEAEEDEESETDEENDEPEEEGDELEEPDTEEERQDVSFFMTT